MKTISGLFDSQAEARTAVDALEDADAGIDESDAHVYAEGIRRGGNMVVARVDENEADAAAAILSKHGR